MYLFYEHNPFTRHPFFNETAFLHKASGTVISADLFWNYPSEGLPFSTSLWKLGMIKLYRPFYLGAMIRDRMAFESACAVLTKEWSWDALLPCHGKVMLSGGKEAMRAHLDL